MPRAAIAAQMTSTGAGPRAERIVLDSGFATGALIWGSGSPTLVLLHGVGDCALVWSEFVRTISFQGTILALDLPGHGDSDALPPGRTAVPALASCVADALSRFDARSYVFMGHSLGAQVAIHLAFKLRRRTAGLVLVEGGPYTRPAANAAIHNALRVAPQRFASMGEYVEELRARLPLADPRVLAEFAGGMLKSDEPGTLRLKCDADVATSVGFSPDNELVACLECVSCPSLVIRGAWSSVLPEDEAQRMLGHIGVGALAEVSAAGHCVPLENPSGLAESVERFLEQALLHV